MANSKAEILLKLYNRLKQSPCTIAILADWMRKNSFAFSERTLYRYLNELTYNVTISGESIEVYHNENNKKTWKVIFDESHKALDLFDINTFYLAKHFVPRSIIEHRQKSFKKIEKILYQNQSKDKFEYLADANHLGFRNTNFYDINYSQNQQQQIEELIWIIQNNYAIKLTKISTDLAAYQQGYGEGNIVYPISFKYHRGVLQLCTYNESIQQAVIIPIDTLLQFERLSKKFNPKKYVHFIEQFFNTHFGISENINTKVYTIALEFSKETGNFIKPFFWHTTQQFSATKKGNIIMHLHCGINRELVGWIFQWMSNIKVLKPAILRKLVLAKYDDCIGLYSHNSSLTYNNSFKPK